MQHRGEILEKAIRESGYSITKLAEKIGKSRQFMYNMFMNPNVNPDILVKVGKVIGYDFSTEVEIFQILEEPKGEYTKLNDEVTEWKNKYIDLLEKHNALLEELKQLKG